jgi:hypothetical protein
MTLIHEWRDCSAWKDEGLPMNTTSNEASKLFDASLSQLVGWRELDEFNGLETSLNAMLEADSNFILGHVLKHGIDLIGSSGCYTSDYCANSLKNLNSLTNKLDKNMNSREKLHVDAIKHLLNGNLPEACESWENILTEHPTDIMALKFAHDTYFYLGYQSQMRDSVARVLPFWKSSQPLYNYLHGMHSFGLIQTNYFEEAKRAAYKSLDVNKFDGWATHTVCHYYEYTNEFNAGIKFLRDSEIEWSKCNLIAPHNFWHLCLYHLERDEHEEALNIYDEQMTEHLQLNRTLDLVDLSSLLFRLKLDRCKIPLRERWLKLKDVYESRINDHGYTFNDAHVHMILSECGENSEKTAFIKSLNNYLNESESNANNHMVDSCNNIIKESTSFLKSINKQLAQPVIDSISYFDQGDYYKVVETLYPIRYSLIKMGGSNAQRDLYHQMLTQSALRSESKCHNKLGLALLNERISLKPNSNLTRRIAARFAAVNEFH